MGQGERIEIVTHCPLTPSLKRSLIPQGIKKSLNLNLKPITIFVAASLIIVLTTALAVSWLTYENFPVPLGPEPLEVFYDLMVQPGFWFFGFLEIIMLGAGWKLLSLVREFNKAKTTSTPVEEVVVVFLAFGAVNFLVPLIAGVAWNIWNVVFIATGIVAGIYFLDAARTEEKGKLKHLKTASLVVLLIVIGLAITPQVAETAGEASSIMNLEGPRIWIAGEGVPESGEYTISTDEYAHVHHGWNSKGQYDPKIYWSELSGHEMDEFIDTSTFELTINGDPIELSCARWLDSELDVYYVIYYIQFKPGDLATGTYIFSGTWYSEVYGEPYSDDYGTCPVTSNVTVNVV
ncbi:MAG: hypothetical protein ACXADC_17515 [Candidatus Thorarchaeota archaeon]|jgi:hypothetical protein